MLKADRRQILLDLISEQSIGRQDELARLLADRGFSVTQASVSRDLEKLGVIKINGRYVRRDFAPRAGTFGHLTFSEAGENLIVVRCSSGLASAAAVQIDAAAIPEIVGTIAGDDTIFVAVSRSDEKTRVLKALRSILESNEGNGNN